MNQNSFTRIKLPNRTPAANPGSTAAVITALFPSNCPPARKVMTNPVLSTSQSMDKRGPERLLGP